MSVVFIAISPGLDRVKCMNEEKFELRYEDHIAVCQGNKEGGGADTGTKILPLKKRIGKYNACHTVGFHEMLLSK